MNLKKKLELARNQLAIAQTAIEAVFLLLDEEIETEQEIVCNPDDPSSHPEEYRDDHTTPGTVRWICKKCGFLYESPEEVS